MLFPDHLIHNEVSRGICFSTRFHIGGRPVSAGFVKRTKAGGLICCGESESLGIASDPEDTARLSALLDAIKPEGEKSHSDD